MKFIHRLAFYLGGFIIGLILLFFFLSGKRTGCDYGPEARTLKNIRLKTLVISENALMTLTENNLDTTAVSALLKNGTVFFRESDTKLDSCKQYVIRGKIESKTLKIRVENCETVAKIMTLKIE